jgi:hypothetical protein
MDALLSGLQTGFQEACHCIRRKFDQAGVG